MIIKKQSPSTEELFTLKDVRDYLRVDHGFDDAYIVDCIKGAIDTVERQTGNCIAVTDVFITCKLVSWVDRDGLKPNFNLVNYPIKSIEHIYKIKNTGERVELESDQFTFVEEESVIYWVNTSIVDQCGEYTNLLIDCKYGYEADELPVDLKTAILNIVSHLYENRGVDVPLPQSILNSLAYYVVR